MFRVLSSTTTRSLSSPISARRGAIQAPSFRTDASTSAPSPPSPPLKDSPPPTKRPGKSRTPPKRREPTILPELVEADLVETFVRGSGPGGQAVNKTSNSCSIIHRSTGIRVQCHETRSRELNRLKARRRMQELLDLHMNPGKSMVEGKWERERMKKEAKSRKRQRKVGSELHADGASGEPKPDHPHSNSYSGADDIPNGVGILPPES